eukprot:RCo039284
MDPATVTWQEALAGSEPALILCTPSSIPTLTPSTSLHFHIYTPPSQPPVQSSSQRHFHQFTSHSYQRCQNHWISHSSPPPLHFPCPHPSCWLRGWAASSEAFGGSSSGASRARFLRAQTHRTLQHKPLHTNLQFFLSHSSSPH